MNKSSMQNQSAHEDGKIVDQAKQAVTHVASNVASQAKEQVNAQFDTRKDKAVETIGNVATAIRETGDKLKGVGPLGDVAGRAAEGMEKVADFFEGKQIGDVVRDVERFARREPALFLGAAFALGLIGGRFLKSSAPRSSGPSNMGSSMYARSGASDYGRYETSYSSSFDDDQYDYLSDADFQEDIDSQRFGSYGSQRVGRTTQPMGSRTGSSSQGSSFGATQGSPAGSSFGASTGSGSSMGSSGTSTTTTKTSSTPPATGSTSTSTSSSTSTPKNGIGGGSGNTGSV